MKRHNGFTLIELVVVILILGILAGVAAPKLLQTSATATDNGLHQTLSVVRDAIELYAANSGGTLPTCTATGDDFRIALKPYIRGDFPKCPVGANLNSDVTPVTGATTVGDPTDGTGWKFNTDDGTFICNSNAASTTGGGTYDTF